MPHTKIRDLREDVTVIGGAVLDVARYSVAVGLVHVAGWVASASIRATGRDARGRPIGRLVVVGTTGINAGAVLLRAADDLTERADELVPRN